MYNYTPVRKTAIPTIITGILFAIAAVCLLADRAGAPYGAVLQILCVAALVIGIQITARYILTEYTYRIYDGTELTNDGNVTTPSVCVMKKQGKSCRTVCSLSLETAIALKERMPLKKLEEKYGRASKVFNFQANMFKDKKSADKSAQCDKFYAYIFDFNGSVSMIYLEMSDEFAEIFRRTIKPYTDQGTEE